MTTLPEYWQDQDSDATTSDDEADARSSKVTRQLVAKRSRREKMMDSADTRGQSFLEWSAVKNHVPYDLLLENRMRHAHLHQHARLVEDDEVDASLVHWANDSFRQGFSANRLLGGSPEDLMLPATPA